MSLKERLATYKAMFEVASEAKHSELSCMEWISDAFNVEFEEVMMPVKVWRPAK